MEAEAKLFTSSGYEIEVVIEFEHEGCEYCVFKVLGEHDLHVKQKKYFYKEEETQKYGLKKEIERLQNEKDAEIKKIQDEAIKRLEARIRINSAFGSDAGMSVVGIQIAEQLKKLIEDKK